MSKPKKPVTKTVISNADFNLPDEITTEIGIIMVRWAYVEYMLINMVWKLADVDPKVGRLTVRTPRAVDRLIMIRDLALLRGAKKIELQPLKNMIEEIAGYRDLLAHGVWTHAENRWIVQLSRGSWEEGLDVPHRKKEVAPQGIAVRRAGLVKIGNGIIEIIERLGDFYEDLKSKKLFPSP
jgi:hypothetical protein